jgi:hypothetical protein
MEDVESHVCPSELRSVNVFDIIMPLPLFPVPNMGTQQALHNYLLMKQERERSRRDIAPAAQPGRQAGQSIIQHESTLFEKFSVRLPHRCSPPPGQSTSSPVSPKVSKGPPGGIISSSQPDEDSMEATIAPLGNVPVSQGGPSVGRSQSLVWRGPSQTSQGSWLTCLSRHL